VPASPCWLSHAYTRARCFLEVSHSTLPALCSRLRLEAAQTDATVLRIQMEMQADAATRERNELVSQRRAIEGEMAELRAQLQRSIRGVGCHRHMAIRRVWWASSAL